MTTAEVDLALPFAEDLEDVLAAWRVRMIAAGLSDRTIDSRTALIRRLARDVDPIDATKDDLINWMAGLADSAGRSARATYRTYLRMWFDFLVESGRRADDPSLRLPRVKVPPGVPHPLTPEEVVRVLAACAHPHARQTRAYVLLAAYAGLRAHEIAKVRTEDIFGDMLVVVGKGGVRSTVPVAPVIRRLAGDMPASGWWFPSVSESGHVHRSSVSFAIQRAFRRAGVVGVPHALRHFYCTQVLRASGGDLRLTQRLARHASPATTAIYTQVLDETALAAVLRIPGAE